MKPQRYYRLLAAPMLVVTAGASVQGMARAQDANDDWKVTGSNTLRLEYYGVQGDPSTGPYPFTGGQYFDEINLGLLRRYSAFDTFRAQFFGVANASDYRAPYRGFQVERFNISREKGDVDLPFRVEAGDIYGYFSYRTLQRSLKGGQLELQPMASDSGIRQSLVFVSGVNQPSWVQANGGTDRTSGVSWLVEWDPKTHVGLNYVQNFRQGDATLGTLDRSQAVASVTGDHSVQWGNHMLHLEGELGSFQGDHDGNLNADGSVAPDSGQGRNGNALFWQFSGQSLASPLNYRLRYERYDRDYRPTNSVVAADHQSAEAHVGWRFDGGTNLRARIQHFSDGRQAGNELQTDTYGVNWSGPFLAASVNGLYGSVDVFRQDLTKTDATVNRNTWNLNTNLSKPLNDLWLGNLGLALQQVNDQVPGANNTSNSQLQLGGSRPVTFGDWSGSIAPGITLHRSQGDDSATTDVSPSISIQLVNAAHTLSASYGYQRLQPDASSLATVDANSLRVAYGYAMQQHTFGVEASVYDRQVTVGSFNDSYRLSVFWIYNFDKPGRTAARPLASSRAGTTAPLQRDLGLLLDIAPGSDFETLARRLQDAGIGGGAAMGTTTVYEQRLINDMTQRQQLAIEQQAGQVSRVALVISLTDPNNPQDVIQSYETARKFMLDRFGRPSITLEEGTIGPTFVADLNAGRILRTMEWETESGKLRLGIPRRLDGQVRIEIQHARNLGSPRDALWSLPGLR